MKTIVFLPEFRSISGSRSLPRDLIESRDGRDLDKVLASSGTIQILPREAVRVFGTARKAIETTLLAKGTRFFGGFLVSEENAGDVQKSLEKIQSAVLEARSKLANNLPRILEDRIAEAPEWEDVIRKSAPSQADIEESVSFGWIKTPVNLADPEIKQVLKGNPLHIKIAKEMSQMASTYLGRPLGSGKRGIPGLGTLKAIQAKARALAFLDGRFSGLDEAIKVIIDGTGSGGPAAGMTVLGVLKVLSDPKAVLEFDSEEAGALLPEETESPVAAVSDPAPDVQSVEDPEPDSAIEAAEEDNDMEDEHPSFIPQPAKTSRIPDWTF
ncbi:DUF3150 domain-containing protein [Acidithiobacillus sp. HP-6]|nr:DUF3150 domain-containing protein [Acidithiobacillus sp. HP-6]MBE7562704.1 DUF3150 domain-containing protein [Acidithiobacillus sp. HP-6]